MKLSTAKRRINKTLDELSQSVIDDWYANFKNGYIKGYADARQGISPMYAEAYEPADTPQTERSGVLFRGELEEGDYRLIKTTDGWVLQGEDIVFCGWERNE